MDKIEDVSKLEQFRKLKTLIITENPFIEKFQGDSFDFLVNQFKRLQRLNKKSLTVEVRNKAIETKKKEFLENINKNRKETDDKE
jgi:diacylglycerol kinase family enzyme